VGRRLIKIALAALLGLAAVVVVLNWTWADPPDEPRASGRFAQLEGARVHYLERPGAEPAIVLIHGLPGTAHDFDRVTRLLPGRRTIALDRPGFGFSSGGHYAFERQLTLLGALLAQLGVERPVLVGHSYGGTIALAYAARRPRAVRGLVLVDAAAGGAHSDFADRTQSRLVKLLSWPVAQPVANVTFAHVLHRVSVQLGDAEAFDPDPVDPAHERRLRASNMRQEDLDAYAGEQLESDDEVAAVDRRLASLAVPAIVIHGRQDKLIEPAHGRRLAAALPDAQLVMVPGGHMAPYVHPAIVARAAQDLLRTP
jgi:pimeloyl-ACP methyl ester carboxylesterase